MFYLNWYSSQQQEAFDKWQEFDDLEANFCELDGRCASLVTIVLQCNNVIDVDEQSRLLSYVDLSLNPERYTGYAGSSAERIWKAIYRENCFL